MTTATEVEKPEASTKPAMQFQPGGETVRIKRLDLCTEDSGNEAIYLDGKLVFDSDTVFAWAVGEYAGDGPVIVKHHNVEDFNPDSEESEWPESFSDLKMSSTS